MVDSADADPCSEDISERILEACGNQALFLPGRIPPEIVPDIVFIEPPGLLKGIVPFQGDGTSVLSLGVSEGLAEVDPETKVAFIVIAEDIIAMCRKEKA
jgi:hypothetical protein